MNSSIEGERVDKLVASVSKLCYQITPGHR